MKVKHFFILLMSSIFCTHLHSQGSLDSMENKGVVAIMGAGVAGLSAAYFLSPEYQVEVLEFRDQTGGNHLESKVPGDSEDSKSAEDLEAPKDNFINLGASYVPAHDSYSRQLFKEFNVPLSPVKMDQVWSDFDKKQGSFINLTYLPYFISYYSTIRFLSNFLPHLKNEVTMRDVLNKLPEELRRKALSTVAYDPFVQKDLDDVLFVPYMNYVFWIFSANGMLAPWGTLTNRHLYPHLKERPGFQLNTGVARIEVNEKKTESHNARYEINAYDKDNVLIKTIHADKIVYAGYPQEGAEILKNVISSELAIALRESFYRKGKSILVKTPQGFEEKSPYFMSRMYNNKEVNAMIDHQGYPSHSRIFFMENCEQEEILKVLDLKEEDIVAQSYDFIHYAPDHKNNFDHLQTIYNKEKSQLADKGIYFSSYNFHPSGFRNADQSIAMATHTAKLILDKDKKEYSQKLKRFLDIKGGMGIFEKIKRKVLNNYP